MVGRVDFGRKSSLLLITERKGFSTQLSAIWSCLVCRHDEDTVLLVSHSTIDCRMQLSS